mgnify:CR=1 FL=1
MRTSRLFWRILITSAGLVSLGILAATAILSHWQKDQFIQQANRRLSDAAITLRDHLVPRIPPEPTASFQTEVAELGEKLAMRITCVTAEGRVLADSRQTTLAPVLAMDNHKSRPEFIKAARDGQGFTHRRSPTFGDEYFYCALAIKESDKTVGFVRTAILASHLNSELAEIRKQIWTVGIILSLVALTTAFLVTKRLISPINILTTAAEEFAAGRYSQRIRVHSNDELGLLAQSLERMSKQLGFRENELRESVQRQSTVLEGMVEGVIAVDNRLRVMFANTAAGSRLNFSVPQVEGQLLLEVVRSHELRDIVRQAQETGQSVRGEISWQSRTHVLTLEVQATPLAGAPSPGVVLVLHDVTDLKRLEGLRQQFVANVSHELKTPLSSIKAYTETLLNGAVDDSKTARHFLTRIDEQATRLHELILDLLSIARMDSGNVTLEFADLELASVVQACMVNHQERAKSAEIKLTHRSIDPAMRVRADEESLIQILGNLIDNALKYTPSGGAIEVRCRVEGNEAVIEVADTGIGIAAEHHARLFERFYRVDKARSRELGGTGLGLAIVKHLCQAMEGRVTVSSIPGKGSVFAVWLPLAPVRDHTSEAENPV